jgi:hypothetical protein
LRNLPYFSQSAFSPKNLSVLPQAFTQTIFKKILIGFATIFLKFFARLSNIIYGEKFVQKHKTPLFLTWLIDFLIIAFMEHFFKHYDELKTYWDCKVINFEDINC